MMVLSFGLKQTDLVCWKCSSAGGAGLFFR